MNRSSQWAKDDLKDILVTFSYYRCYKNSQQLDSSNACLDDFHSTRTKYWLRLTDAADDVAMSKTSTGSSW